MKLAISPVHVISAIIGLSLLSLSERLNPGYGFAPDGIILLGFSIFTLALTYMHAQGESKRDIPGSRKWIRVIYRGLIFLFIGFVTYRSEVPENLAGSLLSMLILSLNQAFLFGTFFDVWYNKFRGNVWDYHGDQSWYDQKAKNNPKLFVIFEFVMFLVTGKLVTFPVFV